jgi:hypothetical protein
MIELFWIFIYQATVMGVVPISLDTKSELVLDHGMRLCHRGT